MAAQPNQYIDPTGRFAESTMRIQDLAQAEKVIKDCTLLFFSPPPLTQMNRNSYY